MKRIHIDVTAQLLEVRGDDDALLFAAPCSTGANGTGSEEGSGCTPLGRFCIYSKHGENAPLNTVFRARTPVGLHPHASQGVQDVILSRILTLHGLEEHNANTRARYIYIHGTADTARLGSPVSHGCIRLSPRDAATLFDLVPLGTQVCISEGTKDKGQSTKWEVRSSILAAPAGRREFGVPFRDGSSLAQSVSSGNNNKT